MVAGPVRAASAISRTGRRSVEVKCSVIEAGHQGQEYPGENGVEGLHVMEVEAGHEPGPEHGQCGGGPETPVDGGHGALVRGPGPDQEDADGGGDDADGGDDQGEDHGPGRVGGEAAVQ